jgi:hypothetical protein
LALPGIDVAKLLHQIAVAPNCCQHQVSAALISYAGRLIAEQAGDRLFVTGQQEGLQSLLGKQSGTRLVR